VTKCGNCFLLYPCINIVRVNITIALLPDLFFTLPQLIIRFISDHLKPNEYSFIIYSLTNTPHNSRFTITKLHLTNLLIMKYKSHFKHSHDSLNNIYQYVLAGVWIVSPQWLADSVTAGVILLEDSYEVPGYQKAGKDFAPKRARLSVHAVRARGIPRGLGSSSNIIKNSDLLSNHAQHLNIACESVQSSEKYLFENTVFLLYGSFPNSGPPRSEIADLLCTGNACVVSSIKHLCMKFQNRDPRSHGVKAVKQVCCTDVGMDGKSSMSSGGESREGDMKDRAYSNQSTEGSKVCTYSDFAIHVIMTSSALHYLSYQLSLHSNSTLFFFLSVRIFNLHSLHTCHCVTNLTIIL
jgi:hypothetical protein